MLYLQHISPVRNLLLFFICLSFIISVKAQNSTVDEDSPKLCKVFGTAFDLQNAVVPNTDLIFQNNTLRKEVISDDEGNYSVLLPFGTYEVIHETGLFSKYKRANLSVSCNKEIEINLYFLPECVSYGCPKIKRYFSSFDSEWTFNEKLNLVFNFAFDGRKKRGANITYALAVLTFDNITLHADSLGQNVKNKTVVADGNIWLENGKERIYYNSLTLSFLQSGVKIDGKKSSPNKNSIVLN